MMMILKPKNLEKIRSAVDNLIHPFSYSIDIIHSIYIWQLTTAHAQINSLL